MPILREPFTPPPGPPHEALTFERIEAAIGPVMSERRKRRIERVIRRRLASVTVVLENLYDPHNGGAALRTCEALGLLHVHIVQQNQQFPISPKVTQRAHKWLNLHLYDSIDACIDKLHSWGFSCWATVPPLRATIEQGSPLPTDGPVALVFGNEQKGLTKRAVELCDACHGISMYGFTESLNLSVSVAVSLRQLTEQRRWHLGRPGDLSHAARRQLRAAYYALSTPHAADLVMDHLQNGK